MKNIFPIILATLFFYGCGKNDSEVLFEMAYESQFDIPAGLNPFEAHYFYIRNIPVGSYLSSNGVVASDLNAINPRSARLSSIFSGFGNYDFIRDLSIRIYTDDENNFKELFYREEVPLNTGEDLDAIPTLIDARQYFENTKFNIVIRMELRAPPQQTLETRLRFSLNAK